MSKKSQKNDPAPKAPSGPRVSKRIHLSEVGKIKGLKATVDAPGFGIKLKLKNDSDDAYRVALTGGVLMPEDSGYQRLLVVGTTGKVDNVFLPSMNTGHCVFVPPHGEVTAELNTCCMDRPKCGPSGNPYEVGDMKAPERLCKAAKAACTTVSLGKASPVQVDHGLVQRVCWKMDDSSEDKATMTQVMANPNF